MLEQNVNSPVGLRYGRWWAAYGAGGSVYLPLVMADSGHQYGTGVVSYYSVYKAYLDAELARPPGADLTARATRIGSRYRVSLDLVNRSGVSLSTANSATIHAIVYEDIKVGVTSRMVRDAVYASVSSAIADGGTGTFTLETHDLAPGDWANIHVIVLADYRPGGTTGAYDMLQAALATVEYYASPVVTGVTPGSGLPAGGEAVTITGTGFRAGATVAFGGIPGTAVVVRDAMTITAITPAHAAATVDVVVMNVDGQSGARAAGYTYYASPTITWANPASIVYGTALGATQLNATANVDGTFVYTPPVGAVLNAGAGQTLSVTFTPTDTATYTTATRKVTIDVTKATPVVTWEDPPSIVHGTALSATQLNATANVAGTFVYTPPAGTVLSLGVGQTLSVTFTPTDLTNYTTATKTVLIDVVTSTGPPAITDVAPGSGAIGSGVIVTGTGFTGATGVTFHGVTAAYTVTSDTQLTATVPAGTTTGPVRVTTPSGTAASATDFVVTNQRVVRSLPVCYVPGFGMTVSVKVIPAPEVLAHAVADTPPAGWTIGTISDGGVWDAPTSQVKWGPFLDATSRVLTYVVTPPAGTTGTVTFAGVVHFDMVEVPLGGTTTLSRCEQHPADANSDFRLVIGEMTGYGAAWKKGSTWTVPPVPIPIGYVTRAGYLWRLGETYRRDVGDCPVCWLPLTPSPRPDPEAAPSPVGGPTAEREGPTAPRAARRVMAGGVAVRQAPATYVPAVPLMVTLTVTPDGDVQTWALEETVPAGWRVSAVSADGYWDEKAAVVRWGPFFDETQQTLRYTLTPAAGASGPQELGGTASFDGVDVTVTGVRTLQRAPITKPGEPGGRRPQD